MSNDKLAEKNTKQVKKDDSENSDKVLYMFTSTHPSYIRSTIDLLALPPGMNYRFRYDVTHLPNELFVENSRTKLIDLKIMDVLLIHIRTQPNPPNLYPKSMEFIPLRKATILDAKLAGDFVWINFLVGDWIKYDTAVQGVTVNPHHNTILNLMPSDSRTEYKYTAVISRNHNLPVVTENFPDDNVDVVTNWSHLVSYVKNFPEHKETIFLKLLNIKDSKGKDKPKPTDFGNFVYGFELISGKSYHIEFLQRYFEPISQVPFDLQIDTNEDDIIKIKSTASILGKYDILKFTIVSDPLSSTRNSFIIIRPEEKITSNFLISRPFYYLKIKAQGWKLGLLIAGLIAGIALTGSGSLVENYSKTLSLFLPVIGGIVSALTAFKMPKK